jgi:hypothetical protein
MTGRSSTIYARLIDSIAVNSAQCDVLNLVQALEPILLDT